MLSNELARLALGRFLVVALVVCRVSGFVLVSPFPGSNFPRPQRVGLVLAVAWIAAFNAKQPDELLRVDLTLVLAAWSELAIGILIGFVFRILLSAAEVAGEVVSHATGLGSPSLFDPSLGGEETPISRAFTLLATLLVLTSGAHRIALGYLIGSFSELPVGVTIHVASAAPDLALLVGKSISVGVRIGLPVLAVCFLIQAGLALVARIAPSLQVFNMGFAILIGAGLFVFGSAATQMAGWFLDHLGALGNELDHILLQVAGD